MRPILPAFILLALIACSPPAPETKDSAAAAAPAEIVPAETVAPAGTYTLDKAHASLIFRVDHLGFSMYTARFKRFDAELAFDPKSPSAMRVTARVDPTSIETDFPTPETHDFNAALQGPQWLDVAQYPEISFRSTRVELTGPNTARLHGDLTLHGQTQPIVLDTTFNGGYAGHPMDPHARIGFSARGVFKRSAFGMAYGIPPEGSRMGVGDDVEVVLEVEFSGPPTPEAAPAP